MNNSSSIDLLGYVLGALEPEEHAEIESRLDGDSELREELDSVRRSVSVLDQMDPPGPHPAGLARRTCESISSLINSSPRSDSRAGSESSFSSTVTKPLTRAERYRQSMMSEQHESPSGSSRRSMMMDFVIVAAVIMLLAAIIFPALNQNRYESRLMACQNNLRSTGMGLLEYSQNHNGKFVPIPDDGNLAFAGIYAPTLLESGFVDEHGKFFCAGSELSRGGKMLIPSMDKLRSAKGKILHKLQKVAGGDYAYSLGQLVDGRYRVNINQNRNDYFLLADSPSIDRPGRGSSNHNGYGQNVFAEDGQIRFLETPAIDGDAIYENDWGHVGPGAHPGDVVVAPSFTPLFNTKVD